MLSRHLPKFCCPHVVGFQCNEFSSIFAEFKKEDLEYFERSSLTGICKESCPVFAMKISLCSQTVTQRM